jgi:glyoxylase-like metal-dependent hydrolase (beta-lactamase superfamily II)
MTPYKIYILQYALRRCRMNERILGSTDTTEVEVPYYVWAITNGEHTAVVDMGATETNITRHGRFWLEDPASLLDKVGINAKAVEHTIVTHLHWDHAGNYELFPRAKFHLQEDEMAFYTGRHVSKKYFSRTIEVEDVCAMVRYNYDGRVNLIDGSKEILPGVTVHRVGGHTKGIQVVEVQTASGPAVIASDACADYHLLRTDTPSTIICDVPAYLDGFETLRGIAKDERHILPGHDIEALHVNRRISDHISVLE